MQQPLAFIPSPSQGSIHLGPLPLRGYALMIILGVIVAVWLGERRWVARGGAPGTVVDIAVWGVPFGLVGGRLYHVITDHQLYFGHGRHPIDALKVWNGGLGIWGAIALGALGAYLGCRRRGISLRVFADAVAPGIALAQGIGRWGNWFNQELYGRPTRLPWAVKIDPAHRPATTPDIGTYQPTFLYECLWCIGVAVLVIWAEKRFRLAYGRAFALYVAAYTVGRAWIEWLRVDEAHHILGLRLNDWTALIVFLGAVAYLYVQRDKTENPPGALGTAADATDEPAEPLQDGDATSATEPEDATPAGPGAEPAEAEAAADAKAEDATPAAPTGEPVEREDGEPESGDRTVATSDAATDEPALEREDSGTPEDVETPEDSQPADREASGAEEAAAETTETAGSEAPDAGTRDDDRARPAADASDADTPHDDRVRAAADADEAAPATGAAAERAPRNGKDGAPADGAEPSATRRT
ncbi:MAG: prolipoprotein diacylglyceryl transferase [Actinoallomurus sp.]